MKSQPTNNPACVELKKSNTNPKEGVNAGTSIASSTFPSVERLSSVIEVIPNPAKCKKNFVQNLIT